MQAACGMNEDSVWVTSFDAERRVMNFFVLISDKARKKNRYGWEKHYCCFLRCGGSRKADEAALEPSVECGLVLDAMSGALGCTCLWWAITQCGENETEVDELDQKKNRTVTGTWFEVVVFLSSLSTVLVVRPDIAVHRSTAGLPWNHRRFGVIFLENSGEERRECITKKMFIEWRYET